MLIPVGDERVVALNAGGEVRYFVRWRAYCLYMTSVTATQARAALGALLTRVEQGEEVTITRQGRAVAVLVRPDVLRSRRTGDVFDAAAHLHDLIAHAACRQRSKMRP